MLTVTCQVCDKRFTVKPNRLKRGWGKYCSNDCKNIGFKKGSFLTCFACNKQIYKTAQDQRRSKSGRYFCSRSCQTKWRNLIYIEEKHANWKGGEASYRAIMLRARVSTVCAKCKTVDRRVLAVHHKDRNRKNNTLPNLVWLCHNCHFLVHHYQSEAGNLWCL